MVSETQTVAKVGRVARSAGLGDILEYWFGSQIWRRLSLMADGVRCEV